ncbi:MAG: HAMP domain-containing histidine kinase [Spirosomaceae bacterium]|nr:HAMP domain-containing histidine kinase [Spirosomataceae bacterium]
MNRNIIRLTIIFGIVSIIGIIAVQVYWVKRAFDLKEQQFRQTVMVALQDVANNISRLYKLSDIENPVTQLSSDYYVVNLRIPLDKEILEHYLTEEFSKRQIRTDFEYGIYDCDTDKIVYGAFLNANYEVRNTNPKALAKTDKYLNYFGVRFPNKSSYVASKLDIWIVSSLVTLVVMAFFGYSMFVILRQKRLSEVQRDFVNNMTHEFQTPISTIQVATDVLNNPKILEQPERFKKYVQIIKQENNRLKNQVETVLTTARLSRGKIEINQELQELHSLIHEVTASVKAELGENLVFELNADRTSLYADKVHLINVIRNLVENAIKYSAKPATVIIASRNIPHGIVLEIRDKGIGIPKEYQSKIFDKFYRVPTGNVHNVKGFGLGLSYVQQIIKAHKWKINVVSEYKRGTTFVITIPQES